MGLTAGLAFGTLFSSNQSATSLFPGHGPATGLGVTVLVPAQSSHTFRARFFRPAPDLVRVTRMGHFPGVRVVARGKLVVELSPKRFSPMGRWDVCVAHRRFCDDYTAHWLALRRAAQMYVVGAGTGRTFKVIWHGTDAPGCGRHTCGGTAGRLPTGSYVGRLPIGSYVLFGLLAGLSAALGFLVPPDRG